MLIRRISPSLPDARLKDISASHVFNGEVIGMKKQSDGKIIIFGGFTQYNGNTRNYMIRLNSDLTEDTSFYTNLGSGFGATVRDIAIKSTGKIVVVGQFTSLNGNTRNYMAQLNSDGTDDSSWYSTTGGANSELYFVEVLSDNRTIVCSNVGGAIIKYQTNLSSNDTEVTTLGGVSNGGSWVPIASTWGSRKEAAALTGGEYLNSGTVYDMFVDSSDYIHIVSTASDLVQHTGGGAESTIATVKYSVWNSNGSYQRYIASSGITGDIYKLAQGQSSEVILQGNFTAINDGTSNFTSQKGLCSVKTGSGTTSSLVKSGPSSSIVGTGNAQNTPERNRAYFRDSANGRTIIFHGALDGSNADDTGKANILYLTDDAGASLVSDDIKPIQMDYGLSKGASSVYIGPSAMIDYSPYLLVSLRSKGIVGEQKWGKTKQKTFAGGTTGNCVLFLVYYK